MPARSEEKSDAKTLAIDVGGTGLKASVLDSQGKMIGEHVRVDTPYPCPPAVMVKTLSKLVKPLSGYDRVSVGFPGVVRDGKVLTAPHYGNEIWRGFDLTGALSRDLGKPVRLLNDADMQGLAVVKGKGLELVITLGTGVGSALFKDGRLMPHLELAHHPLAKGKTYNLFLGNKAKQKIGAKKWNRRVQFALDTLRTLVTFDHLYIGGGNAKKLKLKLPADTTLVDNTAGITGGIALWRSEI
ncbi:MAG: ROK family protein [Acidobacteriota bacterium]